MSPSTVSIRICQEGHANALALNKECNQIAVAGRSLLKVYSIEPDGFLEICNMRGGKNQNLSYSSNDVAWSALDNNKLATAATNGVVSVWDLSKFGRQKQLYIYNEHERTAHSVTFHSTDPNLLISGSQDGTIKCFDLRMDKSIYTYFSNSESVRDVKFSPQYPNLFAAVSENGTVQLWDIKRPDKCQLQFTAHSGPIYTCDWHPTQPWLATGSRDKQIKVWKMDQKPSLEHTIHTIAVVGRVKWRPDRTYHIASCALVVDYSIYIWDVRRPYIPYAAFNDHTNVTTGIGWKGNDPHVLISASKDSTIFKHAFKDATRPNNKANPQGTSFNPIGDLLYSYKLKNVLPPMTTGTTATPAPITTNSGGGGGGGVSNTSTLLSLSRSGLSISQQLLNDQFHLAKSCLMSYNSGGIAPISSPKDVINSKNSSHRDFQTFIGCAKEYILTGGNLSEICSYNAEIARKYGKPNVSMLWKFVKNQYSSSKLCQNNETRNSTSSQNLLPNRLMLTTHQQHQQSVSSTITPGWGDDKLMNGIIGGNVGGGAGGGGSGHCGIVGIGGNIGGGLNIGNNPINNNSTSGISGSLMNNSAGAVSGAGGVGINSGILNDITNDEVVAKMCCENLNLQEFRHPKSGEFKHPGGPSLGLMQSALNNNDSTEMSLNNFIYGEAELTVEDMDCIKSLRNGFLYIGPHDLTKSWSLPNNTNNNLNNQLQQSKAAQEISQNNNNQPEETPPTEIPSYLKIIGQNNFFNWQPHNVLAEGLILQTEVSDVQTAVCILIALGDRRNDLPIDEITYENWLLSYIELLHRHQLWNEAAEIINMSWIHSVREMNQQSTTMHTNCGDCGKPLSSSGWYCNKCKSAQSSKCSVCNQVVTGLYAWCQGCAHGGHLNHLKDWFSNHSKCPKCGHLCEYG